MNASTWHIGKRAFTGHFKRQVLFVAGSTVAAIAGLSAFTWMLHQLSVLFYSIH